MQGDEKPKMKTRKWVAIIAVAIIIVAVAILVQNQIAQRQAAENLQFSFSSPPGIAIGLSGVDVGIQLDLFNPGTITATLDRLVFQLYINNNALGSGATTSSVSVPPGASRSINASMHIGWSELGTTLQSLLIDAANGQNVTWKLVGTAYIDTLFGSISYPVNVQG